MTGSQTTWRMLYTCPPHEADSLESFRSIIARFFPSYLTYEVTYKIVQDFSSRQCVKQPSHILISKTPLWGYPTFIILVRFNWVVIKIKLQIDRISKLIKLAIDKTIWIDETKIATWQDYRVIGLKIKKHLFCLLIFPNRLISICIVLCTVKVRCWDYY